MKKIEVVLLSLCAVSPVVAQDTTTVDSAGPMDCQRYSKPYMSTTTDLGATFTPFRIPTAQTLSLTWGLAALDDTGTLVMHADNALWGSTNDGCNWTRLLRKDVPGIFRVTAGPGGVAYAWQDNGATLFRVSLDSAPGGGWTVVAFAGPVRGMHGFGVDPLDPMHVRTAGDEGLIYDSVNGGATWTPNGVAAKPGGFLGYVIAFDRNDLDHAVYGRVTDGGYVTFDGGRSWTQATGLASVPGGGVNFFNAVISPVDGDVVFAMALDLAESSNSAPSRGRHIYASTDGGVSYAPVLDHLSDGVLLSNGPPMESDLTNSSIVRFLSSSSPAFGGTTFYEYDLSTAALTSVTNTSIPRVRVITSSRARPGAIHTGFDFY